MDYDYIFDELEIRTDPFALCELRGACDLGLGRDASATLHYILSGEGEISIRGRPPLKVARGSLVLIPALQSHVLHSFGSVHDPLPDCKPAALRLAHLLKVSVNATPQSGQLTALCAHVGVSLRGASNLIDLIREPLVESISKDSGMERLVSSLLFEVSHPTLGSAAMTRAILLQAVIEMLRVRLKQQDNAFHWMTALRDTSVWNALQLMLDAPGDPHTVETLAASVGMSRSTFAKRFSDAYGSGPMELLRDLRLRQAGTLLKTTDLPVKRIAQLVGFSSRSAFSRMFDAKTGLSPRAFRKERNPP